MTWIKLIKQSLNSVLVISTILFCTPQALAKKVESDKSVTSAVKIDKKSVHIKEPIGSMQLSGQVNINKVSVEELAKNLKGIGMQKAKAIVEYREKYGVFNSLENILEVQGIGPSFLDKNKDKIGL